MEQFPSNGFDTWQERKKGISRSWEKPFQWLIWAIDKALFKLRRQGQQNIYNSLLHLIENRKNKIQDTNTAGHFK